MDNDIPKRRKGRTVKHLAPDKHKSLNEIDTSLVNTWIGVRLDYDKQLMNLSTAGIGVLISIISAFNPTDPVIVTFLLISLLFFLLCTICLLWVMHDNASYLEFQSIKDEENSGKIEARMRLISLVAHLLFAGGLIMSSIFGILSIVRDI